MPETPDAGPSNPVPAKKLRTESGGRHPLLRGRTPKVWHGDIAHLVPGYPKTQEAYDRRVNTGRANFEKLRREGRMRTRVGVPDGWAGLGKIVKPLRELAKTEARIIVDYLRKEDMLVQPDNELATEALLVAVELHRLPESPGALKLAAARTVLEYTRAKPAQKVEQTVRTAESFLADLAVIALKKD